MDNEKWFAVDKTKIDRSEQADKIKKDRIKEILNNLKNKKPFEQGDIVTTLDGPYAHKGLMFIERKANGMVTVAIKDHEPAIEINASELFHVDDYQKAIERTLVEEQLSGTDNM